MWTSYGQRAAKGTNAVQWVPRRMIPRRVRLLGGQEVVEQVVAGLAPVAGAGGQHAVGTRGDVRVRIDLPVRVRERHSDLRAAVLEAVHLLHAGLPGQLGRAVGPGRHDGRRLPWAQVGEGGGVALTEADGLTAAGGRPAGQQAVLAAGCLRRLEGGKAVLEDDHLIFGGRDLGAAARRRGAQRALVVGGLEGPVLAVAGDDHPLAEQPVPAGLRLDVNRGQLPLVGIVGRPLGDGAEVHQLPAVRERDGGLSYPQVTVGHRPHQRRAG
jgi:hypothetical protein